MMPGVWAYSESLSVAREVSTVAEEISELLGEHSVDIEVDDVRESAGSTSETLLLKADQRINSDSELVIAAISEAAKRRQPSAILVGATRFGREVASRIAVRLRTGCLSEIRNITVQDRNLIGERSVYAGKLAARVGCTLPCVATIKVGTYPKSYGTATSVETESIERISTRTTLLETRRRQGGAVDLKDASVIVSAGRGIKQREDLGMLQKLADAMGGVLGCSRPISTDYGWLPEEHHIGLTGISVHPNLYLAVGISGQLQHIAGMKDSKVVAAINTDKDAPIFQAADYGVVGDLYQVVPALIKLLRGES